ncbi:divergent AAA domain protein [bacterium BMS3Abin04]|nr:divergent AAA domain protein [bacterium BMS3Abin04]
MKAKELIALVNSGEGLTVEFKRHFSSYEKIAKEIIAFTNTKGGYILFGIDDDKSVYGVDSEKGEAELIKISAEQYCEPPVKYEIEYINVYDKEIVVLKIPESENKPHRLQDYSAKFNISTAQVFIRINDKSVPAGKEMIKIMQAKKSQLELRKYEIGKNEKIVFDYLDKNESISVKVLSEIANLSHRRASRTLIKLVRAKLLLIHTKDNGENYFSNSS